MTSNSLKLSLPYIQEGQAQKHVTHNEAVRALDAVVHLAVEALPQDTPPAAPASGARYIVGDAPTGDWAGQTHAVALFDGQWLFYPPQEGWRAEVPSQAVSLVFRSGAWDNDSEVNFDNLDGVGIMTSHDAYNRLSVSSDATLFSHAGAGHRMTLNKSSLSDTASLVFQSNWTGHAEIGLNGSNDLSFKVSADGGTWATGLTLDATTGYATVPRLQSGKLTIQNDSVGILPTPGAGGFVFLTAVGTNYPQGNHSGIFVYDTGSSLMLLPLAVQSKMVGIGSVLPTGTTGAISHTSVAAQPGALHIENRFGSARTYSFTFIGGA